MIRISSYLFTIFCLDLTKYKQRTKHTQKK